MPIVLLLTDIISIIGTRGIVTYRIYIRPARTTSGRGLFLPDSVKETSQRAVLQDGLAVSAVLLVDESSQFERTRQPIGLNLPRHLVALGSTGSLLATATISRAPLDAPLSDSTKTRKLVMNSLSTFFPWAEPVHKPSDTISPRSARADTNTRLTGLVWDAVVLDQPGAERFSGEMSPRSRRSL